MAAVAQLKALLGIDNSQYKAGMRDSESAAKRFQQTISGVGRALGAAFSVGAIINYTKRLVDFASEIRHTADNLEVSTDALQGLNAMGLRYGVTVEMLGRALSKMLIAQDGVMKGEKRYTDALRALNIDAQKFINMDSAGAIEAIGRGYSSAEDQASAFAAVADLLGERVGPRLTAMLKALGDEGLQTVIDKAKEAGSVIDEQLITRLEALGTSVDSTALRIKVGFAEALDFVRDKMETTGAFWGTLFQEVVGGRQGRDMFNPIENLRGAWRTVTGGGIGRALQEAKEQTAPGAAPDARPRPQRRLKQDAWDASMSSSLADYQKAVDEFARVQKRMADINDRYDRRISDMLSAPLAARGQDIRRDSMMAVGGLVGGMRSGVGAADKQLNLMIEQKRRDEERVRMERQRTEDLARAADALSGGELS
jgi:hypothetical protein